MIEVEQLVGHGDTMVGSGLHLVADLIELLGGVGLAPDDIELTTAGTAFGILAVALARCSQCPTTVRMEQMAVGIEELSLDGIVGTPLAQRHARFSMTAVGIAALNHEVLDDAVEEQRIIELLVDEFQEIVAMTRRIVEERQNNLTHCGFEHHLTRLCHRRHESSQHESQHEESELFHFSLAVTTVTI